MQLLSLQYCSLLGLCQWPALAQRDDLDHRPALLFERWGAVAGHALWKRFLMYASGSFSEGKPPTDHVLHPVTCKQPTFCIPLPSLNWEARCSMISSALAPYSSVLQQLQICPQTSNFKALDTNSVVINNKLLPHIHREVA